MNTWKLPTSVNVAGVDWQIETDFRVVIDVMIALTNPGYDSDEKVLYCLMSMIKDFDNLSESDYEEALAKLFEFIDMGEPKTEKPSPRVMDWEQDANLIIPAVNRVVGHEIRADASVHWWTFLGAYMEIGECSYSNIVNLRTKKAKGEKLEKWEQKFWNENRQLVELKRKLTVEEIEEQKALKELLG